MTTRVDLYATLRRYQRALEAIGIKGAATVEEGSRTQGTSYVLEFRSPDLAHPEVETIGRTRTEAERFLSGMAAQAEFVARQQRRDRTKDRMDFRRSFLGRSLPVDPDARSVTRAAEEAATRLPAPPRDGRGFIAPGDRRS